MVPKCRWREISSERKRREIVTIFKCIDCGLEYPRTTPIVKVRGNTVVG